MAVRLELFTIQGELDVELVPELDLDAAVAALDDGSASPTGPVRCVGWVSASDADEDAFTAWCEGVDGELGTGFLRQGIGEDRGLPTPSVALEPDEPRRSWSATVRSALEAAGGARLAWRTSFDLSGTSGTRDDHPTAHRAVGGGA